MVNGNGVSSGRVVCRSCCESKRGGHHPRSVCLREVVGAEGSNTRSVKVGATGMGDFAAISTPVSVCRAQTSRATWPLQWHPC